MRLGAEHPWETQSLGGGRSSKYLMGKLGAWGGGGGDTLEALVVLGGLGEGTDWLCCGGTP